MSTVRTFKLQRCLFPSGGPVLAYDKQREYEGEFPMTKELAELFEGRLKIYAAGSIPDGGGAINILGIVPDQDW